MTESEVLKTIVALISAFLLVGKPIMGWSNKLVAAITKLTEAVQSLQTSNEKVWNHLDNHTPTIVESKRNIEDLTKRVEKLEEKRG